jgi:RNA-dependent RNA polymerase
MTEMYERIKKILINGVTICDRKYEFLAFSSSQLREHSCWMFASTNDDNITVNVIRHWMGDFHDARPVAKFAARVSKTEYIYIYLGEIFPFQLGQSFSTSIKGIKLESSEFRQISDVYAYDENFRQLCFTDGIGIIAPWLAEKLIKEVNPSGTTPCPSAFQIRCGGFKGIFIIS